MLLEFGMKNFFSFREEVSISFRLDANCPAWIAQNRDFTPVICIKGANGSGKTQILKGLAFLAHFCIDSFSNKPDDKIGVASFFKNEQACEFYAEFLMDGITYRYELSTTDLEVKSETIYKTKAKTIKLFERIGNEITTKTKSLHGLDAIKLRKNVSVIATAHQYELDDLSNIYRFFDAIIVNVGRSGLHDSLISMSAISEFLLHNNNIFDFVKSFIHECDVGITDIQIASVTNKADEQEFFPIFIHSSDGKEHAIIDAMESSGTRALFKSLAAYQLTLEKGGVLALDEFDIHLHPHILPKLLDLFLNPDTNPKDAQLVFSTHDTEILNLLGRYRVYLVAKEENESFAFRLDEIPGDILRNDRPIRPAYNEGRIGGVPRL